MPRKIDITGQRFGSLVALHENGRASDGNIKWECLCDCGNYTTTSSYSLRKGLSITCGCRAKINLIGTKFNRLLVLEETKSRDSAGMIIWKCLCDCGNVVSVGGGSLSGSYTKSCGCLNIESARKNVRSAQKANVTHGLCKHPLYGVLGGMIERCYNSNSGSYVNYGGRGITVCDLWRLHFVEFYNWSINNGYQKGLQIDRINNNGNYEPSNCRWTTAKVNANNRRPRKRRKIDEN